MLTVVHIFHFVFILFCDFCFNISFSVICNQLNCDFIVYVQYCPPDIRSDREIYNLISVGSCGNVVQS